MKNRISCETCSNYIYDEDEEGYICVQSMDEDDFYRVSAGGFKNCPFYSLDDEYKIVRKQM